MKMKYTISEMEDLVVYENKKQLKVKGYAFLDETGSCIMIVYGESRKKALMNHFDSDDNSLGIKYSIIDLNKKK